MLLLYVCDKRVSVGSYPAPWQSDAPARYFFASQSSCVRDDGFMQDLERHVSNFFSKCLSGAGVPRRTAKPMKCSRVQRHATSYPKGPTSLLSKCFVSACVKPSWIFSRHLAQCLNLCNAKGLPSVIL